MRRFLRFNCVSALGIVVQLVALWLFTHIAPYLLATGLAVGCAVAHNFLWHWRWTWADQRRDARSMAVSFVRFAIGNGMVSLAGNITLMFGLVGGAGLAPVVANPIAIAFCGVLNFWIADRLVFES